MSTQPDSARSLRAPFTGGMILAGAVPAVSLAGLLAGPSPAPAEALTPPHHAVQSASAHNLRAFESELGLVGRLAGLPSSADTTSRVDRVIRSMIRAGDQIARLPYVYGGGHGSFTAPGYDCSGSVSYVLHGGGLLETPQDSGGLASYGDPGPGRRVTVYANGGHAMLTIDGRRFDTIALQETGNRWSSTVGDTSGYVVRHPHGL